MPLPEYCKPLGASISQQDNVFHRRKSMGLHACLRSGSFWRAGNVENIRGLPSIKQKPRKAFAALRGFWGLLMVEAAGIEPASEKDPRATSTGLDWLCVSPRVGPPIRTRSASFLQDLTVAPASAGKRQPDEFAPHRRIRRQSDRRGHRGGQVPCCLGSAGVSVIVVGNYIVAAFYEASGASACHYGFCNPVETSAPPFFVCRLTV